MRYSRQTILKEIGEENQKKLHIAELAALFHHRLVHIHPFLDGNGRVARAAAILLLFKEGYDVKKFFSLEEHYDRDPMGYYGALKTAESGDLTIWLEYFTEGLALELSRIKEKVQNLSVDLKLKERMGGKQIALSPRQLRIMEYMQETGFIQNQTFGELFPMISEDTVLRDLQDLIKKEIIKKTGITKAAKYVMRT